MHTATSSGDDGRHDREGEADDAVLREHVDGLFRQPLGVLPGGDFLAGTACAFAGFASQHRELILCGGLIASVGLIRLAAQRSFRRRAAAGLDPGEIKAWHFRYALLAWSAALLICIFGWIGGNSGEPGLRLLSACIVFAAPATMVRTGTYPRYMLPQMALALAPAVLAWSMVHDPLFVALTLLSSAYFGMMARIGIGVHRLTFDALGAAARNRALAERLEQKNGLLEQQDADLRAQALRFDAALENMAQGLAMFDADQKLLVCNRRYLEAYRFDPNVVKPGIDLRQLVEHYAERYPDQGVDPHLYYERQLRLMSRDDPVLFTRTLGDGRTVEVNYRPMPGGGYVVTTADVTDQQDTSARIAHLASHDPLTDLVNRYELPRRLDEALAAIDRDGDGKVAVFALGLDRFKRINDSLGHNAGDALLLQAAERLRLLAGPHNIVARLGGDEFVCVVSGIDSREAVGKLAAAMMAALGDPYDLAGEPVEIGASIGIAVGHADGEEAETLLRNADLALHRAKAEGGGGYLFFGLDMEQPLRDRRTLESDLRAGMQRGEFELYYQPLVDVATRELAGCEALLRWNHPGRGLLMPDQFIAIAEDSGLIVALGEWVLRTACLEAADWPEEIKVAVNVSPVQFGGAALLNSVVSSLAQSRLAASRLELEITEAVLLRDTEDTLAMLARLRELGVRIVMDDFGTGYSSLNYLRLFPFDKIKIDRSFVIACKSRSESHAIIQAVADMAQSLGMTTTAEGIETEEQLRAVRDRGCDEAQGYLFARPMPAAAVRRFMSHYSARRAAA